MPCRRRFALASPTTRASIRLPRTVKETHTSIITCQLRKLEIAIVDVAEAMAEAAQEIAQSSQDLGAVASAGVTTTIG